MKPKLFVLAVFVCGCATTAPKHESTTARAESERIVQGDVELFLNKMDINVQGDSVFAASYCLVFGSDPRIRVHQETGDDFNIFDGGKVYLMVFEPDTLLITHTSFKGGVHRTIYRGHIDRGYFSIWWLVGGHQSGGGLVDVTVGEESKRARILD
jgi:hypothetical protein